MLFKCSTFLPRKVLIVIYNSFINSKINYCLESWGSAAKSYINQIHLLQKRFIRIIDEKSPLTHTKPLFLHSLILPVQFQCKYKLLLLAHQTFYSNDSHSCHNYLIRAAKYNSKLPKCTTASRHRRVSYQCESLWNGLPKSIRAVARDGDFKHAVKYYLLYSM